MTGPLKPSLGVAQAIRRGLGASPNRRERPVTVWRRENRGNLNFGTSPPLEDLSCPGLLTVPQT